MKILVTGAAGFIGSAVSKALLDRGDEVVGFDNFNEYYDPTLKHDRLNPLKEKSNFTFMEGDVVDREAVKKVVSGVDRICHLAAMAGVRYSLKHPELYVETNVQGFFSVIDEAVGQEIPGLIYASSSSVYGGNDKVPFNEDDPAIDQLSVYGMTKRSNELCAHTYHHLHGIPVTGLRFFTVYGPWGTS